MGNVQLGKPNNVPSGKIIVDANTTDEIGETGLATVAVDSNTVNFYIKAQDVQVGSSVQSADVTGDGDEFPCWIHGGLVEVEIQIRGFMIENQLLGLEYIVAHESSVSGNNPFLDVNPIGTGGPSGFGLIIALSANRALQYDYFIIGAMEVQFDRSAPFVGLAIQGRATNSNPATMETNTVPT